MTISRMQQPRQMYGLGSLVKSITKGVKEVVKSPLGKAAALYFAPALIPGGAKTLGGVFQNMGGLGGLKNFVLGTAATNPTMFSSPSASTPGIFGKAINAFSNMGKFGKFATTFGIGALGGGALQALEAAGIEDPEQVGNVDALKEYLAQGYKQLNPIGDKDPEVYQAEVDQFVTANTAEYRADGGRIGYKDAGVASILPKQKPSEMMQEVDSVTQSVDNFAQLIAQSGDPSSFRGHVDLLSEFIQKNDIDPSAAFDYVKRRVDEIKPGLSKFIFTTTEDMPVEKKAYGGRIGYDGGTDFQKWLEGKQKFDQGQNAEQLYREYLEEKRRKKVMEQKTMAANGGRIGYAFGNPEQNAMEAAGIEGLPLNQNPAGVKELDLRDSGGFIPPVGVKEKADDIPAMLSNNEFVFTADAVKGMGDGDVNKGAQRMYDMMKKLEGGGRV